MVATSKNEEERFKDEDDYRVVTTFPAIVSLCGVFFRRFRVAYLQFDVVSGQNSNSSELLRLSSLPARIKTIDQN